MSSGTEKSDENQIFSKIKDFSEEKKSFKKLLIGG